jgi:phage baseplate assembly protein W
MSVNISSFLGAGLAFPFRLDVNKVRPATVTGNDTITASIDQIVNTDVTERPFLTKNGIPFGTRIRGSLFDNAQSAIQVIQYEITRALNAWEPRIIVNSVDSQEMPMPNGGSAIVTNIDYTIRANNRSDNFVIPFLLRSPT